MKKTLFLLIIASLVLAFPSCKRSDVVDPPWDGPVGLNLLVEGSAAPAVLLIDGNIHTSQIVVRVTDAKGTPLANRTVFLQQLGAPAPDAKVNWGYFSGNDTTVKLVTDGNGQVRVAFYWPLLYYQYQMWIHAVLVIDGHAYQDLNTPQDYIALTMYRNIN
jgi:hypothetical protein